MISFTVVTKFPFDRCAEAIERFVLGYPDIEIYGQVGPPSLQFSSMSAHELLGYGEYAEAISWTAFISAHAGTGTIMAAKKYARKIADLPWRGVLGEPRSDHQVSTRRALVEKPDLYVLDEVEQLEPLLLKLLAGQAADDLNDPAWDEAKPVPPPLAETVLSEVRLRPSRNGRGAAGRAGLSCSAGGNAAGFVELLPRDVTTEILIATTRTNDQESFQPLWRFSLNGDSRWAHFRAFIGSLESMASIARNRPKFVPSTGASPGFLCAVAGTHNGDRIISVDGLEDEGHVSLAEQLIALLAPRFFFRSPHLSSSRRLFSGRAA